MLISFNTISKSDTYFPYYNFFFFYKTNLLKILEAYNF